MDNSLFANVDHYISELLAPEDEALRHTLASSEAAGLIQMNVSPSQGKFLQTMAIAVQAKRILEVGTLGGYSTLWLARALPSGGKLITLEADPLCAEVARGNFRFAQLEQVIELRLGKALDTLPQLLAEGAGPFDFIFIDADKPPYLEYFEFALKLSRPGTMIVCDNVIRGGLVLDPATADEKVLGVQRLNKALATDSRVSAIIVPNVGVKEFDGMVVAVVK
jgi:caffeoyl-CoA O-methyltransferase